MDEREGGSIPQPDNPFTLMRTWWADAERVEIQDRSAACLATATHTGHPSARMVLVKAVDEPGPVFYTNRDSRKGGEIADNPLAALVFYWPTLARQVRVEGGLQEVSGEEADAYFSSRPRESQLGAWASAQSRPQVGGQEGLMQRFRDAEARFAGETVPRPPYWLGFRIHATAWEFWSQRHHRLHERLRYLRDPEWRCDRLDP